MSGRTVSMLRELRELFSLELGDGDMQTHLAEVNSRRRRLKAVDIDLPDAVILTVLLNSLPEKFDPMILAWEASGTDLDFD